MSYSQHEPPTVDDVLAKIENSPLAPALRDERAMDRFVFDLMTRSDDKVVREMGEELRQGNVSIQGMGEIPPYRDALQNGFEQLAHLDVSAISEQLDAFIAESEGTVTSCSTDDEDEDVFRGLWPDR